MAGVLRVGRTRLFYPPATILRPLRSPNLRFQSTSSESARSAGNAGLIGGVAGGLVVFGLGYSYYHFSGAKSTVNSLSDAKAYVENVTKQIKDGNLQPAQKVQWLRSTAYQYAALIPGAKSVMDQGFKALDEVEEKHGEELNKIIDSAQAELGKLASSGALDFATAKSAWDILVRHLQQIEELAKDVGSDILEKNPELKAQYGDKLKKLKEMSEKQGGEMKKQVDETWSKIQEAAKKGDFDTEKIGKLIQDSMDQLQGYGEEAWDKAMQAAKPFLDKNPEVKKIVEENADKIKDANFGDFTAALQEAAKAGDVNSLKTFVEKQLNRLQGMGDDAWRAAMVRASLYLDEHPELEKLVKEKADALRKIDFEEFMGKLREAKKTGDIGPVKDYIEKQAKRFKSQ